MNYTKLKQALEELAREIRSEILKRMASDVAINSKTGTNTLIGSDLMKSVKVEATGYEELVFSIASYYEYVVNDVKPHLPPISAIEKWVRKKNIRFEGMNETQTVWAVAKSIEKNGIKGRPFINSGYHNDEDPSKILDFLDEYISTFCDKLFELITEEIDSFFNQRT